jgi:uncharacterized protein YcnI
MKRLLALGAALLVALAVTANASAHAEISPPVAQAKKAQVFALAVPTEKASAFTTQVELTLPSGFSIDSFVPSPGWKRSATKTTVTWSGGRVPTGEDAFFQFLASTDASKTYTFDVRQTYSDGSVVAWSGPESSDTPAPQIEARSLLRGGGRGIVVWIALLLGALGLVLGIVALVARGDRELA